MTRINLWFIMDMDVPCNVIPARMPMSLNLVPKKGKKHQELEALMASALKQQRSQSCSEMIEAQQSAKTKSWLVVQMSC